MPLLVLSGVKMRIDDWSQRRTRVLTSHFSVFSKLRLAWLKEGSERGALGAAVAAAYIVALLGFPGQAFAYAPHDDTASPPIDCLDCHALYDNGQSNLPRDLEQETMCESCHNPVGQADTMYLVANHTVVNGVTMVVDCGQCHGAHGNRHDQLVDPRDGQPYDNLSLIRENPSRYRSGATQPSFHSRPDNFARSAAPYNGICNSCHTATSHHRRDDSGGDHTHEIGTDCATCHPHERGFLPYLPFGADCGACHLESVDYDDWETDNAIMSRVSEPEWDFYGHGQAGWTALNPCLYCHNEAVSHDSASNPFRLANENATGDGWNSNCLICHKSTESGYNPGSGLETAPPVFKIDAWHYGINHGVNNDGGARCWDCHDPHGDGTNIAMIGDILMRDSADAYGLLGTRTAVAVQFTSNATGTDYATSSGLFDGICNVCHTAVGHYRDDLGDGHESATACTDCHTHNQPPDLAFQGPGAPCDSCHGAPPPTPVYGDIHTVHDGLGSMPAFYGRLDNNSTATQYAYACGKCHPASATEHQTGGAAGSSGDPHFTQVTTHFDNNVEPKVGASAVYTPGTPVTEQGVNLEYWQYSNGSCSDVYCHGEFVGGNQTNDPLWATGPSSCDDCHGSTVTPPSGGSHAVHTDTYAITCDFCHSTTVDAALAVIDKSLHVDGGTTWSLLTGSDRVGVGATYFGLTAGDKFPPSATFGSCADLYCHSAGSDFSPPFADARSVAWDDTTTCASCHGSGGSAGAPDYANATPKANSHAAHSSDACEVCHATVVNAVPVITDASLHTDGVYAIAAPSGEFTVSVVGDDVTPTTCDNITCHGNASADWGDTLSCDGCHAGAADVDNWAISDGTVSKIDTGAEWTTYGHGGVGMAGDLCLYCHDSAANGGADHYDASNPFRLVNNNATGDGWNSNCLICHGVVSAGYLGENGAMKIEAYHAGAKHTATNDGGTLCWDCHDPHGDDANIAMVGDFLMVDSADAFGLTGTRTVLAAVFTNNATGADYAKSAAPYDGVCNVCHTATAHYTSVLGDGHNSAAVCVACHDHEQVPNLAFMQSGGTCDSCHASPPATPVVGDIHSVHDTSGVLPIAYGEVTNASTATYYSYQCGKCHPNASDQHINSTAAGTSGDPHLAQVNGQFDTTTDPEMLGGAAYAGGSPNTEIGVSGDYFRYANGTCSNVYCHGEFAGGDLSNDPVWATGVSTCDDCHGGSATTPPSGGAHAVHVGNASGEYGLSCDWCHENTTDAVPNVIDKSVHSDGVADWDLLRSEARMGSTATYTGSEFGGKNPPSATFGDCSNVYCHSSGADFAPPYDDARTVSWSDSTTCSSCHGDGPSAGAPHYANGSPKANAHAAHAADPCVACHAGVVDAGPAIISTLDHSNGAYEVSAPGGEFTVGILGNDTTPTRCDNVTCHGGASVAWNETLGCSDCHEGAGDQDSWDINDGTVSRIDSTEWGAVGHGAVGFFAPDCQYCHDVAAQGGADHYDGSNPFRLVNFNATGDGWNSNCLICHKVAEPGYDPGTGLVNGAVKMDGYHFGDGHLVGDGGALCWDCHDPHGDDNNIEMVGDFLLMSGSDSYGLVGARTAQPVVFTAQATGTDYANNGSFDGVCNVCHTTANHYTAAAGDTHGSASVCTSCHGHDQPLGDGFKESGGACDACHSAPPVTTTYGNIHNAHDSTGVVPNSYGLLSNVSTAADYGFPCGKCHPVASGEHYNSANAGDSVDPHVVQVGQFDDTVDPKVGASAAWAAGSADKEQGPGSDWFSYSNGSCSDVYCHGEFVGGDTTNNPLWAVGSSSCDDCHGGSAGTPPTGGAHAVHVGSAGGQYAQTCDLCHASVCNNTPTIIDKSKHVDGASTWSLLTGDPLLGSSSTYSSSASGAKNPPSATYGSCADVYCHSAGSDFSAPFDDPRSIAWSGTTSCGSCHGSGAGAPDYVNGSPKANSHAAHSTDSCEACHANVVDSAPNVTSTALHVNQQYDMQALGGTFTVTVQGDDATPTTCGSITCHGGNSAVWGETLGCDDCHGAGSDLDNWDIADGTLSLIDIGTEWTSYGHGGVGLPAPTCIYCHDSSSTHYDGTNPFRLSNNNATGDGWNSNCLICHKSTESGYDPGTGNVDAVVKMDGYHFTTTHDIGDGGSLCWDCHDPHGDGTNIAHIGSTLMLSGSDSYGLTGVRTGTTVFTDNATGSDFANGTTYNGVCNVCHTSTGHYTSTMGDGHYSGTVCSSCHAHDKPDGDAFLAAGGDCLGCHGLTIKGPRRAVLADFALKSHHVGDGGVNMGGALTNFDCVVCHAEGEVIVGPDTEATGYHMDSVIDLYDADNLGVVYSYDKDAVAASAGAAGNWHSGDAEFRAQMANTLDPFCLSCHDADGATASYAANDGGDAANPFGDGAITNEFDQVARPAITDIESKVTCGDASLPPEGTPCSSPPPEGAFSVHAIRGQSTSRYSSVQIPAAYWNTTKYAWDDTKVMACEDCHTSDGANGVTGNAHGAQTEYLRKDVDLLTNEGNYDDGTYGCYACHATVEYRKSGGHAASDADYAHTSGLTGSARLGLDGNLYGNACTNCHGGIGWGTIHGTSQVLGVGENGLDATRDSYRFMNGASLRYFDPLPWDQASGQSCFTLSGTDSWGGCTKHSKNGASRAKEFARPLSY